MRIKLTPKDEETIGVALIVGFVILGAAFISRIYWLDGTNAILPNSFIMFISAIMTLMMIPALIVIVSAIRELVISIRNRAAGEPNAKSRP